MDKREIYERLKRSPANVGFGEICKVAELFGFRFRGGKGSHRIFVRIRNKRDAKLSKC